jgi:hypothetical protein
MAGQPTPTAQPASVLLSLNASDGSLRWRRTLNGHVIFFLAAPPG